MTAPKSRTKAIRLTDWHMEALEAYAQRQEMSVSAVVRWLIRYYLPIECQFCNGTKKHPTLGTECLICSPKHPGRGPSD